MAPDDWVQVERVVGWVPGERIGIDKLGKSLSISETDKSIELSGLSASTAFWANWTTEKPAGIETGW